MVRADAHGITAAGGLQLRLITPISFERGHI
jgi:hypothetical protein